MNRVGIIICFGMSDPRIPAQVLALLGWLAYRRNPTSWLRVAA